MMGDMQELIVDLPDEIYDLLDGEKIGTLQRKNNQLIFTNKGYIYGKLAEQNLPPSKFEENKAILAENAEITDVNRAAAIGCTKVFCHHLGGVPQAGGYRGGK